MISRGKGVLQSFMGATNFIARFFLRLNGMLEIFNAL